MFDLFFVDDLRMALFFYVCLRFFNACLHKKNTKKKHKNKALRK